MSEAAGVCALCGLDLGKHPLPLPWRGALLQFCCEGCRGIYQMLHDTGAGPAEPASPSKRSNPKGERP